MTSAARQLLSYYLELSYPLRAVADPEGGYVVIFPDLPGCMTQVDSVNEIGPAAEEARRLWITTEYEEGEQIPLPSYPQEYSGKFNLRLPRSLHRRLAELADHEAVSLNQCVVALLARGEAQSRAESSVTRQKDRPGQIKVAEHGSDYLPARNRRVAPTSE